MPDRDRQPHSSPNTLLAAAFLLLTAAIALIWSHNKLMWVDELSVLQTASSPTLAQLIHIQRFFPTALDPLVYQALAHVSTLIFGVSAFAIRLPSLLGFLAMQLCLYLFVRRIAGSRAALVALILPALSGTLYYAAEARPYGALLGIFGLVLIAYQSATRPEMMSSSFRSAAEESASLPLATKTSPPTSRTTALIALALGLALAPNTHYFAILIFIPIALAELTRAVQRRKLDWPLIAAIATGFIALAGILPFQPAVARFRLHYYNDAPTRPSIISSSYRYLLINYPLDGWARRLLLLLLSATILLAVCACIRRSRRNPDTFPTQELVLILSLTLLPAFGYILAVFVTHGMEVRYVLGAIIGIAALLAIAIAPSLHQPRSAIITLATITLALLIIATARIRAEQRTSAAIRASLVVPATLKQQLLTSPDPNLYFNENGTFLVAAWYEPDPEVRSHFALFYSFDEEIRYRRRDTSSLGSEHMTHFTGFPILTYDQLRALPGPHTIVQFTDPWDWTTDALPHDTTSLTPLGPALGGNIVSATFSSKK